MATDLPVTAQDSEYHWHELEIYARRVGLLDQANFAREKQHAVDHAYPYMSFRGFQSSGNHVMFAGSQQALPVRVIAATNPSPQPEPRSDNRQTSLFDFLK